MCFEKPAAHTEPLFTRLQFLKVRNIHELQLLSFTYDCQNKLAPVHFHSFFTPSCKYTVSIQDKPPEMTCF